MSLTIHRSWYTETRLDVLFRFTCDGCGTTEDMLAVLVLDPRSYQRVVMAPVLPATWQEVAGAHYCLKHEARARVTVIANPRLRALPLEI